ncbi:MAG TPA: hypothetical protein VI874_03470 [Candidatus Norongarragalinales archaeon]|nr:hypothetical protein [Candidatus Norongarragalinales archaeon]
MKIDVTKLNYAQIENLVKQLPFELRQVSCTGSKVFLDLASVA